MSQSSPSASGEAEPEHLSLASNASWETVGRQAVARELYMASDRVSIAFDSIKSTVENGEDLDQSDVKQARQALNRARIVLEEHVAPVTPEAGAWEDPLPQLPYGVHQEMFK